MSSRIALIAVIALTGCTRGASLPATLVAEEANAVFDTVAGRAYTERTLTFTNIGDEATPSLGAQLTGDVDAFHLVEDHCGAARVAAGQRCQVTVRLSNDAAGCSSSCVTAGRSA